jgi:hypothetical protein
MTKIQVTRIVRSIKFSLPNFANFVPVNLERLKDKEKWLSDAHVTLSLLFVLFLCILPLCI